jgi:hypothetical protein
VAKGEAGGDIVHTVNGQVGDPAGVILWELKNTKTWSVQKSLRRSGYS